MSLCEEAYYVVITNNQTISMIKKILQIEYRMIPVTNTFYDFFSLSVVFSLHHFYSRIAGQDKCLLSKEKEVTQGTGEGDQSPAPSSLGSVVSRRQRGS